MGTKNVQNPKNSERYLYCLKSLISISLPDWNMIYSIPSDPKILMVGVSPTTFNTEGPITTPAKINPTILGTWIFLHTIGTIQIMPITRVSINNGDDVICFHLVFLNWVQRYKKNLIYAKNLLISKKSTTFAAWNILD